MTIARALALAIALAAGVVGVWRGTWAVGGSDSSCYALMAKAFANGEVQPVSALAVQAPWSDRHATSAPGGFIPSPVAPDAASPVCAPGFALLLAPFYLLGGPDGIFLLTPLAGAVLVYLTFAAGRQVAGVGVGLCAAALVATSPVFIFQIVQPMNDVAVAMLWMAIVVLAVRAPERSGWIGVLTGIAVLVRPNLAPAALIVGGWCAVSGGRRASLFVAGATPFVVLLMFLNTQLYGHPLQTGYGATRELFSASHFAANVRNYLSALWRSQLAFPLVGFVALALAPLRAQPFTRLGLAVALSVVTVYLVYRPLPEWWYLRFLLPALPMLTVLAVAAVEKASGRTSVAVALAGLVIAFASTTPAMRDALDVSRLEHRFRAAGAIARDDFSNAAVFFTVWESGSVRYHADRDAVVWDALDPSALDAAIAWLEAAGREPYLLLEDWEEPLFRSRFSPHSAVGQLDWPPRYDIERRVRIYRPADRDRYLNGERIPTEFVWPDRR